MLQREGKMIIDLKDPNRPRFTLRELQQVLIKRNELQAKLYEVEEELKSYRQRLIFFFVFQICYL